MSSFIENCPPPIPIGVQRYAYQCENFSMEPIHGAISIRAYPPGRGGKEPYPNPEGDKVEYYQLKIERNTSNAFSIVFEKIFKDGSKETYLTGCSFSQLVNTLFEGDGANIFKSEAPIKRFE